jgi:hypothetical protein
MLPIVYLSASIRFGADCGQSEVATLYNFFEICSALFYTDLYYKDLSVPLTCLPRPQDAETPSTLDLSITKHLRFIIFQAATPSGARGSRGPAAQRLAAAARGQGRGSARSRGTLITNFKQNYLLRIAGILKSYLREPAGCKGSCL